MHDCLCKGLFDFLKDAVGLVEFKIESRLLGVMVSGHISEGPHNVQMFVFVREQTEKLGH